MIISLVRIVHFLSMAVWFATPLMVSGDLKRTIARGKPHTDAVVARAERTLFIATLGAIGTIVSGLALLFMLGGFKQMPPRIHAGFGLALITFGVEFFVLKPAIGRVGEQLEGDAVKDLKPALAKVSMLSGITHTLKLVILVLMALKMV